MKAIIALGAAVLAWSVPQAGAAAEAVPADAAEVEGWRTAMQDARWTGPMLASNAETLPKGHFYTEPYFYDVIAGGDHYPGSNGFYQYGLLDDLTVGFQPSFAVGNGATGGVALGDLKLLSQLRLTHFTPGRRIPTVALVVNHIIPVAKHDRLGPSEQGHGSGSFATEVGVNVQHYFLLQNGRLLRGRINLLKSFAYGGDVRGRSVYGTPADFRGRAHPGSATTLIGAVEYSLSKEWVLAIDVIREARSRTTVRGETGDGALKQRISASRGWGLAPAVEYNWDDKTGVLLGVWFNRKGHNRPKSVIPALAISRFW